MSIGISSQWACRLACQLIKASHGDVTEHNCVSAYTHKEEEGLSAKTAKPPYNLYKANVDVILQILRKPRMLLYVNQEQGETAEQLIELLLENGRLTFHQLVKALAARQGVSEDEARGSTRNLLMSLVNFRLVERAPPCSLPPPTLLPHINATKQKRGAKAGSSDVAQQQQRALRGLDEMRYEHLRFKVPNDVILGALADAGTDANAGNSGAAGGPSTADPATEAAGGEKEKEKQSEKRGVKREREGDASTGVGAEEGTQQQEKQVNAKEAARQKKAAAIAAAAQAKQEKEKEKAAKRQKIKAGEKKVEAVATGEGAAAALKEKAAEEAAALAAAQEGTSEVLWRVNYEEFNRRFRHALCVEIARDKFDADGASVLEAMLAAGRQFETQVKEERGSQLNSEEVAAHLRRIWHARKKSERAAAEKTKEEGGEGGADAAAGGDDAEDASALEELVSKVPDIISILCTDPFEYVSYTGDGPAGPQYCVNMIRFLDSMRLKSLEAVVRDRFSQGGMRIFRMLMERGQLEQKQVADFAMLPPKDTRELLYRMLRAGFVFMQDIPKTSDRAPTRTFYTWRVDWSASCERLGAELYRAAGNVWARLQFEMEKSKELLDLVEEAQATGTMTFNITPAQRTQLGRLQKAAHVLEGSLMQLDSMIALFNDY